MIRISYPLAYRRSPARGKDFTSTEVRLELALAGSDRCGVDPESGGHDTPPYANGRKVYNPSRTFDVRTNHSTVKIVALSIGLFLGATTSANQQAISDREKDGLRGPVRSVRIERGRVELDPSGKYREYGISHYETITYDRNGKRVSVDRKIWSTPPPCRGAQEVNDDEGRRVELRCFDSDGSLLIKLSYTYDNEGRTASIHRYGKSGLLEDESTYKYSVDLRGNWIKQVGYLREGESKPTPDSVEYRHIRYFSF